MLKRLNNPCTPNFLKAKTFILSNQFNWGYYPSTIEGSTGIDVPFYVHSFLDRPNPKKNLFHSEVKDSNLNAMSVILDEITAANDIQINVLYRLAANAVHPLPEQVATPKHRDHPFPHLNLLIYLTNAGGNTVCEEDVYEPKENDVIIFEGNHYHYTPKSERRVVIVATFA